MGQKTGMSKMGNKVRVVPIKTALVQLYLQYQQTCMLLATNVLLHAACWSFCNPDSCVHMYAYQNLNSGNLRTKGLNSSLPLLGRVGPSISGSI